MQQTDDRRRSGGNRFSFNCFNHSTYYGLPPTLPDQIAAAAAAGYDHIGLDVPSLLAHKERGLAPDTLRRLLDEAAISCYELVPLSLTSSTEANAQSLATVEQLAVDVDARHVLATVRGPVNNVVVDGLRRAAGALAEIDVAIAVEFMPTTALATLNDARRLVERCATDAPAGIVIDVWHFVLGQSSWSSLADLPLELIGFVQLDDAPADAEGISLTDCMERRELPGEGALPLARFRGALAQRGFAGVVSVEVLSEAWRARPIGEFAAATLRASQRVWLR